jgi:hypothetical protein
MILGEATTQGISRLYFFHPTWPAFHQEVALRTA